MHAHVQRGGGDGHGIGATAKSAMGYGCSAQCAMREWASTDLEGSIAGVSAVQVSVRCRCEC